MCGITAIINISPSAACVESNKLNIMADTLKGRGPDAGGIWLSEDMSIGLTCRRLSTQDEREIANQPVLTNDGTVVAIMNGEIYNHRALKADLENRGCSFRTRNDTEVLANGFKEYGKDVLQKIHGQFAFVVYNTVSREVLIARDPLGICPLYYTTQGDQLIIASTVDAILEMGDIKKKLEHQAVYDYFIMDSVGWEKTFFKGIFYLRSGFCMNFRSMNPPSKDRFYTIDRQFFSSDDSRSEAQWIEEIRNLLFTAVEKCMMGDKEVGVYLSGGVDSVSVMSLVRKLFPDRIVKTFSAGFSHVLTGETVGEGEFAKKMADYYGTIHHEVIVTPEDIFRDIGIFSLPPSSMIDTVMNKLSSAAAGAGVSVALSGEGSDEIFFGYDHFMAAVGFLNPEFNWLNNRYYLRGKYSEKLNPEKSDLDELFRGGGANIDLDNNRESFININETIKSVRSLAKLFISEVLSANPEVELDKQLIYIDYSQKVPENLLRRAEGPSMGNGVEMRFPFLWNDLISFLYHMPISLRIGDGTTKYILRKVMDGLIPKEALNRPKSPFGLPATRREHFRGAGLDFEKPALQHFFHKYYNSLSDILHNGEYRKENLFNENFIIPLLARQQDRDQCHFDIFLWKLWNFAEWYENWMAN